MLKGGLRPCGAKMRSPSIKRDRHEESGVVDVSVVTPAQLQRDRPSPDQNLSRKPKLSTSQEDKGQGLLFRASTNQSVQVLSPLCLRHLPRRGVASVLPLEQEDMRRTLPSDFGLSQKHRSTSHAPRCILFLALTTPLRK